MNHVSCSEVEEQDRNPRASAMVSPMVQSEDPVFPCFSCLRPLRRLRVLDLAAVGAERQRAHAKHEGPKVPRIPRRSGIDAFTVW